MRGWWAIALATAAYFVAVTQRTSMGVASLQASERFHTTAAQLSSLAVLQLVVYAGMQVPVGIWLDRWGPRKLISIGAIIMATGQLTVALSPALSLAALGRMLVGMGDAFTFISMIRLANNWLEGKRAALTQQWLATLGQTGQIASAIPFAFLLHTSGWLAAFSALAAIGVMVAALSFIGIWDTPTVRSNTQPRKERVFESIKSSLRDRAVPLGFWTHFSTQSSGTTFALLWGVPFMVGGNDLTVTDAATLLSLFVAVNAVAGVAIGWTVAQYPGIRRTLVRVIVSLIILVWVAVLAHEGPIGYAWMTAIVVVIAIGGPASMIAFDFSRSYVRKENLGISNGIINVGGFLACFIMIFLIGATLDWQQNMDGQALFSTKHFRFSMATQLIVLSVGLFFFERSANRHAKTLNQGNK